MSWLTLLDASFRGVPFQVEGITDRGEKSLAVHEYPWRPGAEVEDLGRKARIIPVKAIFWGLSYKSGVEALVRALEKDGKGELVHPVFGSAEVCIRSWEISHEADRVNYATVNFEAIEASPESSFFDGQSARSLAEKAMDSLLGGLASAVNEATGALQSTLASFAEKAASVRNRVLLELDGVLTLYDSGRSLVRTGLSWLSYPAAFTAELSSRVLSVAGAAGSFTGFCGLCSMSALLPRLDVSSGAKTGSYPAGARAYGPGWVSGPASDCMGRAEAVLAVRQPLTSQAACMPPAPGSCQTPLGQAVTQAMLVQTQAWCEKAAEILEAEISAPTLTPAEVESVTGNARTRLQDCLEATAAAMPQGKIHPISEGLRSAAQAIQQLGEAALNARPPLITMTVGQPCNFHLLAHRLYGDYTRGRELARINPQVRNPNFVASGQEILAYAR